MSQLELTEIYLRCVFGRFADRVVSDERGSATAEQIVMIGAAVVGAAVVATIICQKMQDGANNIQTPAP
jgi:hypothetical protein